ncbi:hypothetical protein CVD25_09070 [Bacillus canaveralius]|uniref:Uncharacterized protein n=1 Tax=Bacillus canaveralius TaxID=1403243 RepID=A0A2N5GKU5_9BACI|nr:MULTISPECIES: hypothetical protein [Bacillus]PLR82132.1 hypothetical protein CU635_13270 [Bacillus canaveralius]PLR83959.1 hypothetical protein CVD23_12490 [Bacillus sp. V33-4]PLR97962.1 hypothetical protein CVD25_09070 [Bacillus canaveralius]
MKKMSKLEAVLWNIALPGFSQLLIGQFFKGAFFVVLEIIINVCSHFNAAIIFSFLGEIDRAIEVTNFQWLMFYPCLYMFAMWDAYRTAMPEDEQLSYLPFVFAAYTITVGLMLSTRLRLFGILFGPVFLPMIFLLVGLLIGFTLRFILLKVRRNQTDIAR